MATTASTTLIREESVVELVDNSQQIIDKLTRRLYKSDLSRDSLVC